MRAPERAAVAGRRAKWQAGRQAGGQGAKQGAQKKGSVCVALSALTVRPAWHPCRPACLTACLLARLPACASRSGGRSPPAGRASLLVEYLLPRLVSPRDMHESPTSIDDYLVRHYFSLIDEF